LNLDDFAHPLNPIVTASYFDFICLMKKFLLDIIGATITHGFLSRSPFDSASECPIPSFSGTSNFLCKSFILREIAPNVYVFIQGGGPGQNNRAVSNAGFIVGDDSVLVIDTTVAPMHAAKLVSGIRKITDKPVKHVVITHNHGDHFNGTQYFEGADVISHPYVRDEVLKVIDGPEFWPKQEGWSDGTEVRKIVPPTITFEGKMTMYYGRTKVELLQIVPAHTYGDTIVYLPDHGIMWLGDIAFFYVAPWLQHSHPSKWIETCLIIESMNVNTIIPGHGPIGSKTELADMRGYIELLQKESRKRFDTGMSAGAAAADISLDKYDNWIGPERIIMGVQRFYAGITKLIPNIINVCY